MPISSKHSSPGSRETRSRSHADLLDYLARVLPKHIHTLALNQKQGLLSLSLKLPAQLVSLATLYERAQFFYCRQRDTLYHFGLGECLKFETAGQQRFERLAQFYQQQQYHWQWFDPEQTGLEPRAYCAFSYSGREHGNGLWRAFPNALLHIPRVHIEWQQTDAVITFNARLEQDCTAEALLDDWLAPLRDSSATPATCEAPAPASVCHSQDYQEHPRWLHAVNQALQDIHTSAIDKLVLARMASHQCRNAPSPDALADELQQRFPSCTVFSARFGQQQFICATPERLLRLCAGTLNCDAIGGTIGRGADATQDRYLGKRLLADPKARHEHQLVVEAIGEALAPYCASQNIPETPCLLRLPNLQHLWTPIQAQPHNGTSLLSLAAALHPTPAVGGFPAAAAEHWLDQHESTQRGWYSGAAGWIDRQGQGELSVLLRAALLEPGHAHLFAGAGIVADSDPELEWEETEMKLAAMREALGISTGPLHGIST